MTGSLFDNAPRWAVYRRPPRGRWAIVATAATEDIARRAVLRLMDTHKGNADWRIARVEKNATPGRSDVGSSRR